MNNQNVRKKAEDLLEERDLLLQDREETRQHLLKTIRLEYGQNPGENPTQSALSIKEKYPVFFESDEEFEDDGNPNPSSEYKERQQIKNVREYLESELNVNKAQLNEMKENYPHVLQNLEIKNELEKSTSTINSELTPNMNPETNPYINPITNPFIGVNISRKDKGKDKIHSNTEPSNTSQEKDFLSKQTELEGFNKESSSTIEQPLLKKRRVEFSDSKAKESIEEYLSDDYNPFDDVGTD